MGLFLGQVAQDGSPSVGCGEPLPRDSSIMLRPPQGGRFDGAMHVTSEGKPLRHQHAKATL
jgi:hypothetical protein